MSIFSRFFNRQSGREPLVPLYRSIVEEARNPGWYTEGKVPDTLDGRFDMVAAVLALTLVRLEREGSEGASHSVLLTEIFIEDMDGQLRQMGIGDIVVGKHIGKMMSALGGRLSAYRAAFRGEEAIEDALVRNLYRGDHPGTVAVGYSAERLRTLADRLSATPHADIIAGGLPR